MNKNSFILAGIIITLLLFNTFLIFKNPDCPFHVDYIQYTKDINTFYEKGVLNSNVNGKYIYVYIMAILLTPFKMLGLNLYNGMVFITGLFQALIIFLFYKCTRSLIKTILMATTLTFLTFIGHAETIMLSAIFLILFFIYRDKPYSEFFITIASFIRLDSAIFYLFAKKKTALLPIAITLLQWINSFIVVTDIPFKSDFGINSHPFSAFLVFIISYGLYSLLLLAYGKPKKNLDWARHAIIVLFFIFFLKFPSQKVFFFLVILSFIIYDFEIKKGEIWLITGFIILNLLVGGFIQVSRSNLCTADAFHEYSEKHNASIHFGVFQPYLDYRGKSMAEPYDYRLKRGCRNSTDYLIAEDWRNSQLIFLTYKYCI